MTSIELKESAVNISNVKLEIEPIIIDGRFKIRLNFYDVPPNTEPNEVNNLVNTHVQQIQDLLIDKQSKATKKPKNNSLGSYYSRNKDKIKEQVKQWKENHKEHVKKYNEEHKDVRYARAKLYQQQHKEKLKEYFEKYTKSESFKEKQSEYNRRYREKLKLRKLAHENNNVACINNVAPVEQVEQTEQIEQT